MNWVTGKGGVKTWEGPLPEEDDPRPPTPPRKIPGTPGSGRCYDCGRPVDRRRVRCRDCYYLSRAPAYDTEAKSWEWALQDVIERLTRTLGLERDPWAMPSTMCVCETCGCLLGHPDARCPGCLWWATKNANLASWNRHNMGEENG